MERVVVGVVGMLQYEVLEHRMETEYGVKYRKTDLPHTLIRWIENKDVDPSRLKLSADTRVLQDFRGNNLLIFSGEWSIDWALNNNQGLVLSEFDKM